MDPRSHQSRTPSTSLPPQSTTPLSTVPMSQYTMPAPYAVSSQPHTLPPLQQPHHTPPPGGPHHYVGGQPAYRPDLAASSRFPAAGPHEVYASSAAASVGNLPSSSFLSQAPSHAPPHPSVLPPAPSTPAQSYPQPIAPAPPRDRRSDYSGMASGAFSYAAPPPDDKATAWMGSDPVVNGYAAKDHTPRMHQVVGSQGRRGILPSVPGRPGPIANAVNASGKSAIPVKDADGKFPCPNCNKTYLHAKHLKRHLLRRELVPSKKKKK